MLVHGFWWFGGVVRKPPFTFYHVNINTVKRYILSCYCAINTLRLSVRKINAILLTCRSVAGKAQSNWHAWIRKESSAEAELVRVELRRMETILTSLLRLLHTSAPACLCLSSRDWKSGAVQVGINQNSDVRKTRKCFDIIFRIVWRFTNHELLLAILQPGIDWSRSQLWVFAANLTKKRRQT